MTRTTGGGLYVSIERREKLKSGKECVIIEDPTVAGAMGYGDTREQAAQMLAVVREDLLTRGATAQQKPVQCVAEVNLGDYLVSGVFDGFREIWKEHRTPIHA